MKSIYIILHGKFNNGYNIYPQFFTNLKKAKKQAGVMVDDYNTSLVNQNQKSIFNPMQVFDGSDGLLYSNAMDFISIVKMNNK